VSMISVIIPTFNESDRIEDCLQQFRSTDRDLISEIIVTDGGSSDDTREIASRCDGVIVIKTEGSRASAMNAGAKFATGDILLFIHADCRLEPFGLRPIANSLSNPKFYVAGAFDLEIDSKKLGLRLVTLFANIRSWLTGVPYGDQAIFVRRDIYESIGGYPSIPIMEDVSLCRQLKKVGKLKFIHGTKAVVSPRRWEKDGIWYSTIRNWTLVILFLLGVSPHKLEKYYT